MDWMVWLTSLHKAICNQIELCYIDREDGRWDENIITADILRALKLLHKDTVILNDIYRSISWNSYKLKGCFEQTHGDIALIVRINLEQGRSVEGVAFLEAKRITHGNDISSGSFLSIKWDRLKSYAESSPAHYTVFYDYLSINNKGHPRCESLLTAHLLALGDKKRAIYRHSEPMANLLGFRLLMGYGLDYRESIVASAAGFSDSEIKYKYVVTADVSVSSGLDATLNVLPILINSEKYVDIDSSDMEVEQEINNEQEVNNDDSSCSPF